VGARLAPEDRGERSTDPRSPTGFKRTDEALHAFLRRRKAQLDEARRNGTLSSLLALERQEAIAEMERRAAQEARDREEAARRAAAEREAFARRRGRSVEDLRRDRAYMGERLRQAERGAGRPPAGRR
jgi:hypothetical protein